MKKLPAYGKALLDQRRAGKKPGNSVVVSIGWPKAKNLLTVVVKVEDDANQLEFSFLSGLDVIIAHQAKDAGRVLELALAILKVKPRMLQAFNADIPKTTIIKHSNGEVYV